MLVYSKQIFILILISFGKSLEIDTLPQCLDPFALVSVDARVHEARNTKATTEKQKNFNLLDEFYSIDIIEANVTQLCEGMIKNFPVLEELTLININLTTIDRGAFQNLPKLKHLSLAVNQIKIILKGVFNNLPALKALYLSQNEIETIESEAFANLPKLKSISLDHNRISQLNGNLFSGSLALSVINFNYNMLTSIDEDSFVGLTSLNNKILYIYLKNNKISSVHSNALKQLAGIHLHLEHNEMRQLADVVLSSKKDNKFYLDNNQISCVADNVIEWINANEVDLSMENNPINCDCLKRIEIAVSNFELNGNRPKGEINIGNSCIPGSYTT